MLLVAVLADVRIHDSQDVTSVVQLIDFCFEDIEFSLLFLFLCVLVAICLARFGRGALGLQGHVVPASRAGEHLTELAHALERSLHGTGFDLAPELFKHVAHSLNFLLFLLGGFLILLGLLFAFFFLTFFLLLDVG